MTSLGHAISVILALGLAAEKPAEVTAGMSASDAFVGLLDSQRVRFINGSGPALYLESEDGRWLCITRKATGLHCYTWPAEAPRIAGIETIDVDEQTRFVAGTKEADFHLRVDPSAEVVSIGPITCKLDHQPLDFTLPPSRAPKRPRLKCDRGLDGSKLAASDAAVARTVAKAFAELPLQAERWNGAAVTSVEHQGYGIVSVGLEEDSGWDQEKWTCLRFPAGKRVCGETSFSSFRGMAPESTLPGAWLLMLWEGVGRGHDVALVWVTAREGKLATATLHVGGNIGNPEDCNGRRGCMGYHGEWVDWKLLSPSCVRIGRTVRWKALWLRGPGRWINERILPTRHKPAHNADDEYEDADGPPLEPGTYRPGPDEWQRSSCEGPSESQRAGRK